MTTLKKAILVLTVLSSIVAMASCGSKYNNTKFKDPNEGNVHVYGVDSAALNGEAPAAEPAK